MDSEQWLLGHSSTPLLQQLRAYSQHEQRKTVASAVDSSPSHPPPRDDQPPVESPLPPLTSLSSNDSLFADFELDSAAGASRPAVAHRSFDASLLSASASSLRSSRSMQSWSPNTPNSPLQSPLHSPPLRFLAPSLSSRLSPPLSRTAAMWRDVRASHQRQVDALLQHSSGSSSAATSDAVLSQLSLLEMGRAMRERRIVRQHVQAMQLESHQRLLRRCWYAWLQRVCQQATVLTRADEWRRERRQRRMSELSRQCVRVWAAAASDRRGGALLRELSALWLCRRYLHAWHSLLYVHHARLHLALMHRHAVHRERVRLLFDAWQGAAHDKTRDRERRRAVELLARRRMQARLRLILRRWSGFVSLERQCRAAVQAAMVSAYKHIGAVRPLLLSSEV